MKISIIGIGRLGGALALAFSQKGFAVSQLISRRRNFPEVAEKIFPPPEILSADELEKISSEVIFITTPDAEIGAIARALAEKINYRPFVFHASGALSSNVLQRLKNIGCPVASLHPLVAVSDAFSGANSFKGVYFCLEGELSAVALGEKIVGVLEGKTFFIPAEFKSLYHASAVTASGHLVALFSAACEMLAGCGIDENTAQKILFPLVNSTVDNLSRKSPAQALTGTFARADVETLEKHLAILRAAASPELLEIYRQLGLRSLHLAEEQGAGAKRLAEMKSVLTRGAE